jgi:hypothetical protein
MTVETIRACEISVRQVLLDIQSASDLAEAARLYQLARAMVASTLALPEADPRADAERGLLALALYVHCVYRTKEAAARGETRLLSAG